MIRTYPGIVSMSKPLWRLYESPRAGHLTIESDFSSVPLLFTVNLMLDKRREV
jgi:hypothetical protein